MTASTRGKCIACLLRGAAACAWRAPGVALFAWLLSVAPASATYVNPVIAAHSPDPWVVYADGYYYHTRTTGGDIKIYRTASLATMGTASGVSIFRPNTEILGDIWAPELHYLDGRWFVYSCGNISTSGRTMRMFVLESNSQDPQGAYTYRGIMAPISAIDATVLTRDSDGARFLVWSQFDSAGQSLYIGPLNNPWTLGLPRIRIASATYAWEKSGSLINEGPEILKRGDKTMIIYSASGTWTPDYCLGMLVNTDGNYTNASSWTKFSNPVFRRSNTNGTYCVGHGSFTVSPSGGQDWHVYHGTSNPLGDQTPYRNARIQRFWWNSDHTPNFDVPTPSNVAYLAPDEAPGSPPRGLHAEFFNGMLLAGTPTLTTNFTMHFDWGLGAPVFSVPTNRFSARWTGMLYAAASGAYALEAVADDGVRLWIDNQLLIDDWTTHGLATNSATVNLPGGAFHNVRLEYFKDTGSASLLWRWRPPGGGWQLVPGTALFPFTNGLKADYFSGANLLTRVHTRLDPTVDFNWGGGIPEAGLPADNFSVRWTGRLRPIVTGDYTIHTISDDGVRLWLGGELLIDNWNAHPLAEDTASITLQVGRDYNLRLEYCDRSSSAVIQLLWTPPGASMTNIPPACLFPGSSYGAPFLSASPSPASLTLTVDGESGPAYAIDALPLLPSTNWQTIHSTNPLTLPFSWTDPNPPNQRFYRARAIP